MSIAVARTLLLLVRGFAQAPWAWVFLSSLVYTYLPRDRRSVIPRILNVKRPGITWTAACQCSHRVPFQPLHR